MTIIVSDSGLSDRAREYFGGDVQRFWIERESCRPGPAHYNLWQLPHYYPKRVAATVCARWVNEAAALFNAMAAEDDRSHA